MSNPATITSNGKTFTEVGRSASGGLRYIKPSKLAEDGITGEILEGVYLGPIASNLDDTKNDFKFQTATETVIINNTALLAKRMADVPLKALVKVMYDGKEEYTNKKGKNVSSHVFRVLVSND